MYINVKSFRQAFCLCVFNPEKKCMCFNKLFKNNVAVSPVVGTLLMLAITVILAAIYSSTAFNQEPTQPAPKASIEIIANATATDTSPASIKLEHLGGD